MTLPPERTRVTLRRAIAHFVDGVLIMLVFFVLAVPAAIVSDIVLVVVLVGWIVFGQLAYFVWFQRRDGKTPGKQVVGIKVVDEAGNVPTTGALVKRTLPLYIEYFYVFALMSMLASSRRQRFGDRWAKTYVISE